jgi:F420H(2)-dependent quinone reductase
LRIVSSVGNAMSAMNRWVYQATKGRIGGKFGKAPVLLLTTRGRKSGQPRTQPLLYVSVDGDRLVVVASAGGQPSHPAWYLNLLADRNVEVQIGGQKRAMRARTADEAERARYWQQVTSMYPRYADYQKKTTRTIPLVVLEPR